MSIVPILVRRRKEVLKHLISMNAVSLENAKTFEEILAGFEFGLIKGMRKLALEKDLSHLVLKKNVAITADGKYYLAQ